MTFDEWFAELNTAARSLGIAWIIGPDQESYRGQFDQSDEPIDCIMDLIGDW